jgi:hypothetical protein
MAAQHSAVADRSALKVAPTHESSKFNAVRIPLVPVACWRLNDPAFEFDSSFASPKFRGELDVLRDILVANQDCPAALFGHCDPDGSDALNKTLGDRRAIAVYALLTHQPDLWEYLYDTPQVGDMWGTHMVQRMLNNIPDGQGNPYYAGSADGLYGPGTTDAVKRFQVDNGLSADGQAGPDTRKVLFGAYMDWLCTSDAATNSTSPAPYRMQPADFLGGAGSQPGGGDLPRMSLQSCGKLNPIVLLTNDEMNSADKATRHDADAPNRRVIMFLFQKGTKTDPSGWPCPKVKDPGDACSAAFWPDGDTRRKNEDAKRLYKETRDTMACRFYDRFARRSPCERGPKPMKVRWVLQIPNWASGKVQLVILNTSGKTVVTYALAEANSLGEGWVAFDLSALDPTAELTIELRSGDVCVLPPVRIIIGAVTSQTGSGSASSEPAYAFNSLVRPPNRSA